MAIEVAGTACPSAELVTVAAASVGEDAGEAVVSLAVSVAADVAAESEEEDGSAKSALSH